MRETWARGWRRALGCLALTGVLSLVFGCSPAATAPPAASPSGSSGSPSQTAAPASPIAVRTLAELPTTCPMPAPSEGAVITMPPAGMEAGSRKAIDELMAAVGNPDVDSQSEAWKRFEAAISSGDATSIRAAADEVLGHLEASRQDVAPYLRYSVNLVEWDQLIAGIAEGVTGMRDGAVAGESDRVQAGRDRMQAAILDHFWQSIRGPTSDEFWHRWPAPDTRIAIASHTRYSQPLSYAFDGKADTAWWAGADSMPPQWIEVDFGKDVSVAAIRLQVYQDAAGLSEHVVTARSCDGTERGLATFSGQTGDGQWLEYIAPTPVGGVRSLRITTTASTGPIGWREIDIRT
jgi:hypothetical protein